MELKANGKVKWIVGLACFGLWWVMGAAPHLRHHTPFHQIFQFDFIPSFSLYSNQCCSAKKETSQRFSCLFISTNSLSHCSPSLFEKRNKDKLREEWGRAKRGLPGKSTITNSSGIQNLWFWLSWRQKETLCSTHSANSFLLLGCSLWLHWFALLFSLSLAACLSSRGALGWASPTNPLKERARREKKRPTHSAPLSLTHTPRQHQLIAGLPAPPAINGLLFLAKRLRVVGGGGSSSLLACCLRLAAALNPPTKKTQLTAPLFFSFTQPTNKIKLFNFLCLLVSLPPQMKPLTSFTHSLRWGPMPFHFNLFSISLPILEEKRNGINEMNWAGRYWIIPFQTISLSSIVFHFIIQYPYCYNTF